MFFPSKISAPNSLKQKEAMAKEFHRRKGRVKRGISHMNDRKVRYDDFIGANANNPIGNKRSKRSRKKSGLHVSTYAF